ncbi:toll/interleukin-1 receptor domain-containing protein [Methylomonas sp. UP202]|uniref:toll/interleukin-1 receptor domain-containing protein n=2 Tax=unclassified Methylomonas TaxID=2608980 RepID=UPI00247ADD12|nr:toll/interleukin-1 receptor domain-containing protein [Methylomonas sp. UP202]WGS84614.1 toll/interleukin-1 receptor domain-containing protein [Methylomonas sp. UP202]
MSNSTKNAITLFYSYSHKDEEIRNELDKHLSILKRQGVISEWYDRKISGGTEWESEIDQQLQSASIILLLISSDFLASDYCYGKELKIAMERHESGQARVIPIIIRSVDWNQAPFGKLQALPKDAKPVKSWNDVDEAFTNIAQGIRTAIDEIKVRPVAKETTTDISALVKKFKLRPKKYAGTEIIADIKLKDKLEAISTHEADSFNLSLGDAIFRIFTFTNPDIKNIEKIYAEGKIADWLENAISDDYRIRLRFLFSADIYEDRHPITGEPIVTSSCLTGYRLIEVIDVTKNEKSV